MNTKLAHAIEAVNRVLSLATDLANRNDAATCNVTVADDNTAFFRAVTDAEAQVQTAMDEVEGRTLTKLDYALTALGNARNAWIVNIESNRRNALDYAREAARQMPAARSLEND